MPKTIFGAQIVLTAGINNKCRENPDFNSFIASCIERFKNKDWGELPAEDAEMNEAALGNEDDRLFAAYDNVWGGGKVYVITECDGSLTTILFADEY